MSCGKNASSAGSIIPEKECPQAGQTNVYVSNPQLSITGSSDLRNGTAAEQLGHSAMPALPENGNFETFSTRDKSSWSSEGSPSVDGEIDGAAGKAAYSLTTPNRPNGDGPYLCRCGRCRTGRRKACRTPRSVHDLLAASATASPLAGVAGQRLTTPRCCSQATCTTQQRPLIRPALSL